ncbi:hypothetical protein PYW08_003323 [Mythimna loreyi]|uniref:Uncharacterized protein n=1 Tax=Mythimna loreyi TaxID=667449 RepID=A0ACC2QR73_9NEOP|nr:hypothetical protein PYW08_003323 [Mythimna loreyi]
MFIKYLLCITLFSKQTIPLLHVTLRSKLVNNNSIENDPDSLSRYAKYEEWNPRVVNGWPAKLGDVPYQVALKTLESRSKAWYATVCGASIIGPRKLISAAHCFEEDVTSKCNKIMYPGQVSRYFLGTMFAVAGTLQTDSRYNSDGQWRRLKKVVYPKEVDFPEDDIAIIILKQAYSFDNHVAPIPMATKDIDYEGKCLVSGYGKTGDDEDSPDSPVLLMAHLTIIPNKMCSVISEEPMDDFVCTSVTVTNAGEGDSGGPLVCRGTGDPAEGPKGVSYFTCGKSGIQFRGTTPSIEHRRRG